MTLDVSKAVKGWRTWDVLSERCNHCCNGDRCDDASHYDRTSSPGCPHCLNTGFALWTEQGRKAYETYKEYRK